MRAANYSSINIFNKDQIIEINNIIKSNFIDGKDKFAVESNKTSQVRFVSLGKIEKFKLKQFDNLDHPAKPRWPLDEEALFLKGAGVKI